MSQKKTITPGLGHSNDPNFTPFSADPSFYQRSTNAPKGTVVSGMGAPRNAFAEESVQPHQPIQQQSGKPVVGFLYSISRTSMGEYWPLHIGANTIGQSSDCDIVLREGTVSAHHAEIIIRVMKNPVKTTASIRDLSSTNGIMVNGISMDIAESKKCNNGDIVIIGDNYELLFILIDSSELKLSVSENFIPVANEETNMYKGEDSVEPGKTRPFQSPAFGNPAFEGGGWDSLSERGYQGSKPTVGINGGVGTEPGGTVGM